MMRIHLRACSIILSCALLAVPTHCFAIEANPEKSDIVNPPSEKGDQLSSAKVNIQDREVIVDDFEHEDLVNKLGGSSGTWNLDPDDPQSSIVAVIVKDDVSPADYGSVLRLTYRLNPNEMAQNGYWTKLGYLDARPYDFLQFDYRGDAQGGYSTEFKIELKKPKDEQRIENIKGTYVIQGVSAAWRTARIPLNKMTGLLNFYDPKVWEDPSIARQDLDEFVINFESRRVTSISGSIYIDNIKFVHLGTHLPTAVDSPPRKGEKTPVRLEGIDFARFLADRLNGFPSDLGGRKRFPRENRQFLKAVAKDTWRYFDQITDRKHQLPLDTIQLGKNAPMGEDTMIGDYTNITYVGLFLLCLVSAHDLGFITKKEAIKRIQGTLDTLERLERHKSGFLYNYYDTTTLEKTSYFISLVDSGWLDAGLYVVRNAFPDALKGRIDKLLFSHNYSFFYDKVEQQMFHGYYGHLDVYSDYHYGALYTEPRAISFLAIARGDVPDEHWFRLVRTFPETYSWQTQEPRQRYKKTVLGYRFEGGFYEWEKIPFVPSWGGSAFEALMPTLIVDEKRLAPEGLGLNDQRHVDISISYTTRELGYPVWGMSPSSRPEGGYGEFGVPILGSKGYNIGVVTPHASVLALEFAPEMAVKNLRTLIEHYDLYGPYGFYDSVNVKTGLVAKKYLALDQGMILVAINNYLNQGAIRKRFHSEPGVQAVEKLLKEEKLFEVVKIERSVQVSGAKKE